jgi:hypothetical protein
MEQISNGVEHFTVRIHPQDLYIEAYNAMLRKEDVNLGRVRLPKPLEYVFSYMSCTDLGVELSTCIVVDKSIMQIPDNEFRFSDCFRILRRFALKNNSYSFAVDLEDSTLKNLEMSLEYPMTKNSNLCISIESLHQGFTCAQRDYRQLHGIIDDTRHLDHFAEEVIDHKHYVYTFVNNLIRDVMDVKLPSKNRDMILTYDAQRPFVLNMIPQMPVQSRN